MANVYLYERKYKIVSGLSDDDSGGLVIPDGKKVGLKKFFGSGSDPEGYVALIWDYEGDDEIVFVSTRGDFNIDFDLLDYHNQIEGDGEKTLKIIIFNNGLTPTPLIGGYVELTEV